MFILSFDPGETTGWCYQDENEILDLGQCAGDVRGITEFLEKWNRPVDHVVCEEYKVLPGKAMAHIGTKVLTVRVIGAIENWCIRRGYDITYYPSSLTTIQAKQTGLDPRKKGANHKNTHWAFAANHGSWYLIRKGLKKTQIQKLAEERKNAKQDK